MDKYACDTLRTRAAFHWLKNNGLLQRCKEYLEEKQEKEDGSKLWKQVPKEVIDTVVQAEIGKATIEDILTKIDKLTSNRRVDVIVGGPPCQAYSVAGRARMGRAVENNPRNELYKYYVKFLEHYQPEMFVFETVLGIRTAKGGRPFEDLKRLVRKAGYTMQYHIHITSEHGVLQKRQRVIIIGWKNDTAVRYPNLKPEKNTYQLMNDLFVDLPERKHGEGQFCVSVKYEKPLTEVVAPYGYSYRSRSHCNGQTLLYLSNS
jgi:DNA (cytosine-5)-methyltransferase 1